MPHLTWNQPIAHLHTPTMCYLACHSEGHYNASYQHVPVHYEIIYHALKRFLDNLLKSSQYNIILSFNLYTKVLYISVYMYFHLIYIKVPPMKHLATKQGREHSLFMIKQQRIARPILYYTHVYKSNHLVAGFYWRSGRYRNSRRNNIIA